MSDCKNNELDSVGMELPLIPLDDIVIFPHMLIPVFIDDDACISAVEDALQSSKSIFFSAYKKEESGLPLNVYDVGLICTIIRTRMLPDGRMRVLVNGNVKAKIEKMVRTEPYPIVKLLPVPEVCSYTDDTQAEVLIQTVRKSLEKIAKMGKVLPPDFLLMLDNISEPGRLADLIAANMGLKIEQAQKILVINDSAARLQAINKLLQQEIELFRMQVKIQSQTCEKIGKEQKENYLREQIKVLKSALGDSDSIDEISEFWQQVKEIKLSPAAEKEVVRNIRRLEKMHKDSSEANIIRSYLEHVLGLPWQVYTQDNFDLKNAKQVLDKDHFGLDEAKDRIIEYLAVKKLNPCASSPILCFVGPPGVGKTSLGNSIAKAMGRKFNRVSLGGVRDEADIRGHRKTYVGAYPGRIIQCIRFSESNNPVIMLDEIDKIGADNRGDPASALLEVLDSEQNSTFVDHFIGIEFDLSRVLFITNANTIATVPHALRDRLEVINLSGYSADEKVVIATQYLIPKQLTDTGLNKSGINVSFSKPAISKVINDYTRESGLRTLEKKIASVCRKVARQVVEMNVKNKFVKITPRVIRKQLGTGFVRDFTYTEAYTGVALALAYTPFGGEILAIECNILRNNQARLKLTGQVGKVMNESAHASLSFVVSNAQYFGIDPQTLIENEVHIHVPAGATPKDGPSAGVSITTAILSAVLNLSPPQAIAMTGEITLHGRILAVGGLKEKLLAAQRHNTDTVVVPKKNHSAVLELPAHIRKSLKIHYINDYFSIFGMLFGERGKTTLASL